MDGKTYCAMNLTPSEHDEQVTLFAWAELASVQYPQLKLLFAIPNGGARHPVVGAKLKKEGVKAGVPDLFLPVARGDSHGLFIELKTANGRPTPIQREWLLSLHCQGYKTVVAYGWDEARSCIEAYLQRKA